LSRRSDRSAQRTGASALSKHRSSCSASPYLPSSRRPDGEVVEHHIRSQTVARGTAFLAILQRVRHFQAEEQVSVSTSGTPLLADNTVGLHCRGPARPARGLAQESKVSATRAGNSCQTGEGLCASASTLLALTDSESSQNVRQQVRVAQTIQMMGRDPTVKASADSLCRTAQRGCCPT